MLEAREKCWGSSKSTKILKPLLRLLHKISNDRFNKTDITLLGSIHSYCRADNLLVVVVPEPLKLYIDSSCK